MYSSVCVFNNKVFCLDPSGVLVAYEYSCLKSNTDRNAFKEVSKFKIPIPIGFKVQNLFLNVVKNYSLGLKCLIILAIDTSRDISAFIFCETLKKTVFQLKNLGWPKWPTTQSNDKLFITHGPTLMLFQEDAIHIYSLLHNTKLCLEHKTILSSGEYLINKNNVSSISSLKQTYLISKEGFKVLQVASVGQINKSDPINVFLFIVSYGTSVEKEVHIASLGVSIKHQNKPETHQKLCNSLFFPKCFQSVAKYVHVTNIAVPGNSVSSIEDVNWKDNFTFVSTEEDCMLFSNGDLKYVTRLASPEIVCIKSEFCDFKSGNIKLLLVSEDENVHLLTTSGTLDPFGLQLTKTWFSIKNVLCGDILSNGSKHLLLLKDTDFHSWQNDCILSDISSDNPQDIVCQTSESDAAMSRAIPGLLSKVQRGECSIVEAQSRNSKKLEATLDALFRLKDHKSDVLIEHHVSTFQESLVNIILHTDENYKLTTDTPKNPVNLKVHNHWIRFIDDKCVFCWTFNNFDERTIFNPTLVILIQNYSMQCSQKLFVHKLDDFSIEDEFRRQINPGEKFSIVVHSEVPEFQLKSIEVSAILSWYIGTSLQFENEIYLPIEDKTLIQQQMKLQTQILSSDIFHTQLKDMSSADCLACMKVIQQRIILTVLSLHSDVALFDNVLLTSSYGAAHMLLIENRNRKCLVFKSANLPLFGVHMIFNCLNSKTLEIEAFTKNDKETYLLVQFLYQHFPEDILIIPNGICHSEKEHLKQQAVRSLKEEVDLLLSTFTIYNIVEMINENNEKVLNEAGTIIIPKETFMRIRKTLVKKECVTDNVFQNLFEEKLNERM